MRRTSFARWPCSIARTMDLLGDWWTPLVLREAFYGFSRFDEFQRALGIARNTLTDRLRRLVDEGLLEKRPYQDEPRRYDYVLTDKGREFFAVLAAMTASGDRWLAAAARAAGGGPPRPGRPARPADHVPPRGVRARHARGSRVLPLQAATARRRHGLADGAWLPRQAQGPPGRPAPVRDPEELTMEWTGACYADNPTVEVTTWVDATPERVWELVSDVTAMPAFSTELQAAEWLDDAREPVVGARFRGRNQHEKMGEWETTSQVVECERPAVFAWAVQSFAEGVMATWRFRLAAQDGGAAG